MEQTYNTKQVVIIFSVIIAVIAIFYGITIVVSDNNKEEVINNIEEPNIQYTEILVGEIYNQNENEYYVLAYDGSENSQTYVSSLKEYTNTENSNQAYFINLLSAFNKKYLSSESNFDNKYPTFKCSTLLKINNGNIVEVYEEEQITTKLEELMG